MAKKLQTILRLEGDVRELVDSAAKLMGLSRNAFLGYAAKVTAEQVIKEGGRKRQSAPKAGSHNGVSSNH